MAETEKTERELQILARRERMKALVQAPQVVQVNPKNDAMRKHLRHMPSRVGFPPSGPAMWPLDRFTQRRLRDGDVTLVDGGGEPPAAA